MRYSIVEIDRTTGESSVRMIFDSKAIAINAVARYNRWLMSKDLDDEMWFKVTEVPE